MIINGCLEDTRAVISFGARFIVFTSLTLIVLFVFIFLYLF